MFTPPDARLLVAQALVPTLTHLAVGDGVPADDASGLAHELARTVYLERTFVVVDPAGPLVAASQGYRAVVGPTNLIYFRFRFLAAEALGMWAEFALHGGGVDYVDRAALLLDSNQSGDDHANDDVALTGAYSGTTNQTITVTVTTGGGSGVAAVSWVSSGALPAGSATVTFGVPVALGTSGVALAFDGGGDGLLTLGDQWQVRCTTDAVSPSTAEGGVYHPVANEAGQVRVSGYPLRMWRLETPAVKGAQTVDVKFVVEVLRDAA